MNEICHFVAERLDPRLQFSEATSSGIWSQQLEAIFFLTNLLLQTGSGPPGWQSANHHGCLGDIQALLLPHGWSKKVLSVHVDCDRLYLLNTCRHYRYQSQRSRHGVTVVKKEKKRIKGLTLRLHYSPSQWRTAKKWKRESTQMRRTKSLNPSVSSIDQEVTALRKCEHTRFLRISQRKTEIFKMISLLRLMNDF